MAWSICGQIGKEAQMPILALFRWHADPDALVAAYDREMKEAPSVTLDPADQDFARLRAR
jgi:hypothetical protein